MQMDILKQLIFYVLMSKNAAYKLKLKSCSQLLKKQNK